jgi:hypothetical protein
LRLTFLKKKINFILPKKQRGIPAFFVFSIYETIRGDYYETQLKDIMDNDQTTMKFDPPAGKNGR